VCVWRKRKSILSLSLSPSLSHPCRSWRSGSPVICLAWVISLPGRSTIFLGQPAKMSYQRNECLLDRCSG
jgi:hypothetical protein